MMGIRERDRQALGSIEHRLACSDPALASMLAFFTRLTAGEAMPVREKIGAPHRRARRWPLALLSLWLIVSVGLIAVALILSTSGHDACTHFIGTMCSG